MGRRPLKPLKNNFKASDLRRHDPKLSCFSRITSESVVIVSDLKINPGIAVFH